MLWELYLLRRLRDPDGSDYAIDARPGGGPWRDLYLCFEWADVELK